MAEAAIAKELRVLDDELAAIEGRIQTLVNRQHYLLEQRSALRTQLSKSQARVPLAKKQRRDWTLPLPAWADRVCCTETRNEYADPYYYIN